MLIRLSKYREIMQMIAAKERYDSYLYMDDLHYTKTHHLNADKAQIFTTLGIVAGYQT